MVRRPKIYPSWDLMVFMLITVVGFGFAVQRIMYPKSSAIAVHSNMSEITSSASRFSASVQVVDLGCLGEAGESRSLANNEGLLCIRGRICQEIGHGPKVIDNLSVKNLSTGYAGTIFQNFDYSFTTENLILQPGKNIIKVEWKEPDTSQIKHIVMEVFQRE